MNFSMHIHPIFEKYIVKNGIGVCVCYDDETDFNEDAIETNNYGIHDTWTIIEAGNVVDAIKIFQNCYEGAKVGGQNLDSKALRIDRGRKIVQIPFCNLMARNKDGRFTCGPDGSFGDCVIGGIADLPGGECSMKKFCHISSFSFSKRLPKGYVFLKIFVGSVVYKYAELESWRRLAAQPESHGTCKYCQGYLNMENFPSETIDGWKCPHCGKDVTAESFNCKRISKGIMQKTS